MPFTYVDEQNQQTKSGASGFTYLDSENSAPKNEPINPDTQKEIDPKLQKLQGLYTQAKQFENTTAGKIFNTLSSIFPTESEANSKAISKKIEKRKSQLARGLSDSQSSLENLSDDAKSVIANTARFAPFAIAPGGGAKVVQSLQKASPVFNNAKIAGAIKGLVTATSSGSIIGGARFVEELAKGNDLNQSSQEALNAGVSGAAITLGLSIASGGVGLIAKKIAPMTKKTVAEVSEVLNSVPADDFEYALNKELNGQSVFKQPFDKKRTFQIIGKRVQKSLNYLNKQAGRAVGAEKEALKTAGIKVETGSLVNKLDDMVNQKSFQGESSLTDGDLRVIKQFKAKLLKEPVMDAAKLNVIKAQVYNELPRSAYDIQTVGKISSEGEGVLKQFASEISSEIGKRSPSYSRVNQEFSQIRNLRDRLSRYLKDENIERNLRNIYTKDENIKIAFQELDDLAPKGFKFYDKLRSANVRMAFEQIAPGKGGGSGDPRGFLNNVIRGGVLVGSGAVVGGPIGAAAVSAGLSPAIGGKGLVKLGGASPGISKAVDQVLRRGLPIAASRKEN